MQVHHLDDLVTQKDRKFIYNRKTNEITFITHKDVTVYELREDEPIGNQRHFVIVKDDGEVYELVKSKLTVGQCTCKGWQYRKQCRHMDALKELIDADEI